jgi:hypothetical protein
VLSVTESQFVFVVCQFFVLFLKGCNEVLKAQGIVQDGKKWPIFDSVIFYFSDYY